MKISSQIKLLIVILPAWIGVKAQTPIPVPTCSSTENPFVFEVALMGGCSNFRVELNDAFTDEEFFNQIVPTSITSRTTRQIICINKSSTAVNWTLSVSDVNAPGCCIRPYDGAPCETTLTERGPFTIGPTCTQIPMGIANYGEDAGNLNRFQAPTLGGNGCDTIQAGLPQYCSPTGTGGYGEYSEIQWFLIKNGNRQPFATNPAWSSTGITITNQSVIDVFGSVNVNDVLNVVARDFRMDNEDGSISIVEYPMSQAFNLRSPAPKLTLSLTPSICTTPGSIRINTSTISNAINSVEVTIFNDQNEAVPISNHGGAANLIYEPSQLNNQIFNLDAGNYSLRAININNSYANDNCASYYDFTITHNDYTLTASPQVTHETCFGLPNDGAISLSGFNGQGPYTFSWRKDSNPAMLFPNNSTITGLTGEDTYDVSMTDSYGCTGQLANLLVIEPAELLINSAYVSSNNGTGVSCHPSSIAGLENDGQIVVEAEGGTGSLQYRLVGNLSSRSYQSEATFLNLSPDSYSVYVTDANNCETSYQSSVNLSSPPLITFSGVDKTDIQCSGTTLSEGSITVLNTSGGSGGFEYSIDGINFQLSDEFRYLPAGTYSVKIRDIKGCEVQANQMEIISEALHVSLVSQQDLVCLDHSNGTATISIEGGSSPYTINWSNGQSALTATDLPRGDHMVKVTDDKGCEGSNTVTIESPEPLSIEETITPPTCAEDVNGSISVSASGGNGGYTYTWQDGASGSSRTNLPAGTYELTVQDQEGCDAQYEVILLPPPGVDLGEDRTICAGQPVTLTTNVLGTYEWSSSTGFSSTDDEVVVNEPGAYQLVVTDINNCVTADEVVLTTSNDLLTADFLMVSEAYEGDTIVVIDISWPEPDAVTWDFPAGAAVVNDEGPYVELRFDEAGTYSVSVNASLAGCSDNYTSQVTVFEGSRPSTGGRIGSDELIRSITLSPNPTDGKFKLAIELREEQPIEVRVVTTDGSKVLLSTNDSGKKNYEWEMRMESYPAGVYFVAARVGSKVKIVRLVKI